MIGVTILGSTGSIGKSTLSILGQHKDKFKVIALTAHTRVDELFDQCLQFSPHFAVLESLTHVELLKEKIKHAKLNTKVLGGREALQEVAAHPDADYVMAGIVGAAGLLPTLAAAKAGKRILLANKEALVMSGALLMDAVRKSKGTLLPVDSEHNALFQSMPPGYQAGTLPKGVEKVILTASGGPFRTKPLSQFEDITPQEAIAHPTWNMGAKISVDSATMMNKGLEVIEAHWLFKLDPSQIEVLIHPQSIIHSMVSYVDGSMLAQLGTPDMRTPIAYTLSWPERITTNVQKLNLIEAKQLTFEAVDYYRFPCLKLAYEALQAGGTASAILNAANEVAVAAFLERKIGFTQIPVIVKKTLEKLEYRAADSLEVILETDEQARSLAEKALTVALM